MSLHTHYWDSSVFVAYFNDEPGRADIIESLLNDGTEGRLTIITSAFACVEVLKLKDQKHLSKENEEMISDFFEYPFIKLVDATRGVCVAARHLIWKYPSLKPKDAVHLASALAYVDREYLDVLFSYDTDFLSLDGAITQRFHIKEPYIEQLPLFQPPPSDNGKEDDQPPPEPQELL
jgi:predicted nucleic acid-binding protein